MSRQNPPPFARKTSAPWDRLRPVRQDPLETVGYVSKGDNRLLDIKLQESFYHKIVARYMHFCSRHKKNLDSAFSALSIATDTLPDSHGPNSSPTAPSGLAVSKWATTTQPELPPPTAPADELSIILTALRKLREGLLATSSTASSPVFAQRVHIFNVRVAILAMHPPSYHPSLSHLLRVLHTREHPLPDPELREMTTYMILDLALRQNDLVAAFQLKHDTFRLFHYRDRAVDKILRAVAMGNWVWFWDMRQRVDGYIRALMHWHIETIKKSTLKIIGRAYMKVDLAWLLKSVGGGEMSWSELVAQEGVGWSLEGDNVVIRKPKTRGV